MPEYQWVFVRCVSLFLMLVAIASSSAVDHETTLSQTLRVLGNSAKAIQEGPEARTSKQVANAIRERFDRWLKDPAKYRRMATKECAVFPEGKIYPFALPAIAYANMAVRSDIKKEHAVRQMRKLLDTAIPNAGLAANAPRRDVRLLRSYQRQGTILGTLNYALGAYRLVSDDGRYDSLHHHLSTLLRRALEARKGAPIDSYPAYTWYFDTIMALASLDLYDRANQTSWTTPLLDAHLQWREEFALAPESGLPRAFPGDPSRGCDLSFQICLLGNLKPSAAQEVYQGYVEHHWIDHGFVAGFSEWPKGYKNPAVQDIDSGPVLFGIGGTATGMGIGAAKAVGDEKRHQRLTREIATVTQMLRSGMASGKQNPLQEWFGEDIVMDDKHYTGFLYGDIALFYATTWTKYSSGGKKISGNEAR